jgi:hypothetical protein
MHTARRTSASQPPAAPRLSAAVACLARDHRGLWLARRARALVGAACWPCSSMDLRRHQRPRLRWEPVWRCYVWLQVRRMWLAEVQRHGRQRLQLPLLLVGPAVLLVVVPQRRQHLWLWQRQRGPRLLPQEVLHC